MAELKVNCCVRECVSLCKIRKEIFVICTFLFSFSRLLPLSEFAFSVKSFLPIFVSFRFHFGCCAKLSPMFCGVHKLSERDFNKCCLFIINAIFFICARPRIGEQTNRRISGRAQAQHSFLWSIEKLILCIC